MRLSEETRRSIAKHLVQEIKELLILNEHRELGLSMARYLLEKEIKEDLDRLGGLAEEW